MKPFLYAFKGIATLFRTQRNARFHLVFLAAAVVCGFLFKIEPWEWCVVLLAAGVVLAAEALNTALEFLADALHPEQHPKVGGAKDLAAAGVLFTAIAAVLVGLIIFVPKIL